MQMTCCTIQLTVPLVVPDESRAIVQLIPVLWVLYMDQQSLETQ